MYWSDNPRSTLRPTTIDRADFDVHSNNDNKNNKDVAESVTLVLGQVNLSEIVFLVTPTHWLVTWLVHHQPRMLPLSQLVSHHQRTRVTQSVIVTNIWPK